MWKEKHVSTEPDSLFSEAVPAALLLKARVTDTNTITLPHNSTLKQKIPNTPLVISKIPDDIEHLVDTHGTALAGLV